MKLAAISNAKHAPTYDVKTDWWKQLREFIPKNHKQGGSAADLFKFVNSVTLVKQNSYSDRVAAYASWWGNNALKSAGGKPTTWSAAGLDVTVNPELFLSVNGVRHIIKLYFKQSEKLSVDRANVVLRLLELTYHKGASPAGHPVIGILDLAQTQFIVPTKSLAFLDPLLAGEAAAFTTMWPSI